MSNEQSTSNAPVVEDWGGYNVMAVSFEDGQNAYNALTQLGELDSQKRVGFQEAVVVVRDEDGQLIEKDRMSSNYLDATAGGGLLGLLIGVIGGPLGMLIGGASGVFAGSMFDLADIEETESALGEISSSVRTGQTTLLAVVKEESPDVVDAAMVGLGGKVSRRPVADVQAEIAAAEEAERKAKWEARKELVRGRHEQNKAAVNEKLAKLKAKLHHDQGTAQPAGAQPAEPAASGT